MVAGQEAERTGPSPEERCEPIGVHQGYPCHVVTHVAMIGRRLYGPSVPSRPARRGSFDFCRKLLSISLVYVLLTAKHLHLDLPIAFFLPRLSISPPYNLRSSPDPKNATCYQWGYHHNPRHRHVYPTAPTDRTGFVMPPIRNAISFQAPRAPY